MDFATGRRSVGACFFAAGGFAVQLTVREGIMMPLRVSKCKHARIRYM